MIHNFPAFHHRGRAKLCALQLFASSLNSSHCLFSSLLDPPGTRIQQRGVGEAAICAWLSICLLGVRSVPKRLAGKRFVYSPTNCTATLWDGSDGLHPDTRATGHSHWSLQPNDKLNSSDASPALCDGFLSQFPRQSIACLPTSEFSA